MRRAGSPFPARRTRFAMSGKPVRRLDGDIAMSFYLKDPDSRVDYAIDWIVHLGGQAITNSLWSVTPAEAGGIAIDESSFDSSGSSARLSGGLVGHVYSVGNRVTLADGRIDEGSIVLRVEER